MFRFRPDSDELTELKFGKVDAARINDLMSPKSKAYRYYLDLIHSQAVGEQCEDDNDQYRVRPYLPMAIAAYERKNGVTLEQHRLYQYRHVDAGLLPIIAIPDGMEGDGLGVSFHIRQTLQTYRAAVGRGVDQAMLRHAHAMMRVCGVEYWLHVNCLENTHEFDDSMLIERNDDIMSEVETALLEFAVKTRQRTMPA